MAENQKRQGLTPLDLARFIRGRIDMGGSNSEVARRLGMNLTTVAHHLSLLELPPVLDEALKSGRCTSPRTLHELGKLHDEDPDQVASLLSSGDEITRAKVAELRSMPPSASVKEEFGSASAKLIARAVVACDRLEQALARLDLSNVGTAANPELDALLARLERIARRRRQGSDGQTPSQAERRTHGQWSEKDEKGQMAPRIGGPPVNGCHAASGARFDMPGASRDRVTIDLRGIGDAVRAAAAARGMGVAQLVRRALVMSLDLRATAAVAPMERGSDGQTPRLAPIRETAKLTLRLSQAHADALMLNAGALGLSYGDYVGRLVAGSRLPQPAAQRQADRAALMASNDRMAAQSTDLAALVTLLRQGKEALRAIADQWRLGGTRIPEVSERREAFSIMLSMTAGTDARVVRQAAREFARAELANHRYVMFLHTHQANPHVHISVRAEGRDGKRLNPRKEDLHRWRETFAEKLRDWGIEAEASSQPTRGIIRRSLHGWERQPDAAERTRKNRGEYKSGPAARATRSGALKAWAEITKALAASPDPADRKLSKSIVAFVMQTEVAQAVERMRAAQRQKELPGMTMDRARTAQRVPPERNRGPDMSR